MHWMQHNLASGAGLARAVELVLGYWSAGGWLMLPLSAVCFLIWWRYLALLRRLKGANATQETCIDELRRRLGQAGNDSAVSEWLGSQPGAVPRLARHLLARIAAGLPFRDAFDQCRDGELAVYLHSFYVLGALVVAAPLLGLLGTVFGMIETFDAVSLRSGDTAELVAGGISQALITTQVGLVAALPGTFGLAHLFRLYERLKNDIERCGSHLYIVFQRLEAAAGQVRGQATSAPERAGY